MHRPSSALSAPLVLLALALPSAAQSFGFGESEQYAAGELFVRDDGASVEAVLRIEIDPGWHLYHDDLGAPDAVGKPTSVLLDAEGVEWDTPEFGEAERYDQPGLGADGGDTWILGHEDELIVRVTGTVTDEDLFDAYDVMAEVSGLTCETDGLCVPYSETLESEGRGPDALFEAVEEPFSFALGGPSEHADATASAGVLEGGVYVELVVEIDAGWHLYHDDLGAPDAVGKPTSVELEAPGVTFGTPRFSEPERYEQPGLGADGGDTWILGHADELRIVVAGELEGGATFDPESLSVTLSGLTCEDDGQCVPYDQTIDAAAFADATAVERVARAITAASASEDGAAGTTEVQERSTPAAEDDEDDGLATFLGLAVIAGLVTLLMPCTYPMIPITISFFTKQAEARGGKVLPLALAYGAGIVTIFVGVGVLIGPAVIDFATDPVVNLLIGAAFVYFALVLFGALQLNPPRFLMNAAGQASSKGGVAGVFLMGATLVVTSFTCTAPFVGSLLTVGSTGEGANVGRIALGMGVFGLTLAIPFVILSLLPGRMSQIPRAGAWMNTLKVSLGFIELAAALKFISNADIVWQWGFLSRELFLLLWLGIFLTGALYLFGFVRLKGESGEIGAGRMVGALGFLLFGIYCGYGATGRQLDPVMTAMEPNYTGARPVGLATVGGAPTPVADAGGKSSGGHGGGHTVIVDDYEAAVATAMREDKLLMVNFTGFTCVNCRQMERFTFPAEPVASELRENFVEARLHTDGKVNIDRIKELQMELARTVANPYYVLLDPESGLELAKGAYMSKERFAAFLRGAREKMGRG